MYGFLANRTVSKESIENRIISAKNLLNDINNSKKELFFMQLNSRISDFESALMDNQLNSCEKNQVLAQYDRFAKTLYHCLNRPDGTSSCINYYHGLRYYPVGIHDTLKPNPLVHNLAMSATTIGLALLIGSIPAFVFNPVMGSILLSLSITILFPATFYLCIPESPDTSKKKEQERNLFQTGALLIKPELMFDEPIESYSLNANLI